MMIMRHVLMYMIPKQILVYWKSAMHIHVCPFALEIPVVETNKI